MNLKPIIPFEPVRTEQFPIGDQWIAQVKWDGVRILTYYDGHEVKLMNRKQNVRTLHYPELTDTSTYCKANSFIIDGEVIAISPDGKPSFHEVMRRDAIRRMERVKDAQKLIPITYMVFDIVYCNGQWIHDRPLRERMELLSDVIIPNKHVQLVTSHPDSQALYKVIKDQAMEGIVVKDLESKYYIDGKNDRWQKVKYYRDLIAVVGGVTMRDGVVNAVLLGLYDKKGGFWYIGHAGTGKLTQGDWMRLTERIKPLHTKERPFANKPERIKEAIWVKPMITAKIQFAEWTPGHTLRQPSIQAFVDTPAEECRLE